VNVIVNNCFFMKLSIALFFATTLVVSAQSIEVPHKLQFADMTLTIRDDARREIQKDVDALTRYPKSFNIKVERARTYFPLIEKIFAEENVPDDFKYLVIQESALVADAVSVSNAVGYWQFKDFTAIEMGLRVDRDVDERMNIVSATRAAARYIKKNNTFFNNWLFALQAYQMGAGGVLRSEKESKSGQKNMDITSGTYWYVKKYLAHKIAYEGFIKGSPEIQILAYSSSTDKRTLAEIAREVNIDEEQIKLYNKWLRTHKIPDDRTYAVMIPVKGDATGIKLPEAVASTSTVGLHENSTKAGTVRTAQQRMKINGIMAIRSNDNETPTSLANRAGVELLSFLKWNDISISDRIIPGIYYLLGKKRSRAESAYHKVQAGESLWSVSQQYGVQMRKLRKFNRLSGQNDVRPGMTLWLSTQKPKDADSHGMPGAPIEVSKDETFAWDVTPAESQKETQRIEPEVLVINTRDEPAEENPSAPEPRVSAPDTVTTKADTVEPSRALPSVIKEVVTIPSDSLQADLRNPVAENPGQHVVQPKETLYGIARQYNVGVMDLVNWNGLDLQQGIKPGQVIRLTQPEEIAAHEELEAPMNLVHEVKATDTVYSIARKYGVTIKDLMEWNNKRDFNLAVGEKLKIVKR
jgi:membrane-bound lytic murein transglycosylase D